jgi:DNA modification methylase
LTKHRRSPIRPRFPQAPKFGTPAAVIHHGDALKFLKTIPSNSIDSIVSDLPAGIGFMGKHWDGDRGGRDQWISWMQSIAVEALRVVKPGAHALVWALPRTSHWSMTAFENAGWEIRDVVHHLFGQGFPKGKNLKPAVEHWILLRKPLIGSIASNVLIYGTGQLNIDACRVPFAGRDGAWGGLRTCNFGGGPNIAEHRSEKHPLGRWPANLVLSNVEMIDGFPHTKSAMGNPSTQRTDNAPVRFNGRAISTPGVNQCGDEGSAARYFNQFYDEAMYVYAAKATKADRNGSRHPTVKGQDLMRHLVRLIMPKDGVMLDMFAGSGSSGLAACTEGYSCILIEQELEYYEDCLKRLASWLGQKEKHSEKAPSLSPEDTEMI